MIEYKSIEKYPPPMNTPLLVRGPEGHCIAKRVHFKSEFVDSIHWIALADNYEVDFEDSGVYCPEPTEWADLA